MKNFIIALLIVVTLFIISYASTCLALKFNYLIERTDMWRIGKDGIIILPSSLLYRVNELKERIEILEVKVKEE